MRDRTDDVRKVVEAYGSFDFVPLKIQDAFDSGWWAGAGGTADETLSALGLDMTSGGRS
jgi:cytoplasmic tRNA 2-thiolation protein 2